MYLLACILVHSKSAYTQAIVSVSYMFQQNLHFFYGTLFHFVEIKIRHLGGNKTLKKYYFIA